MIVLPAGVKPQNTVILPEAARANEEIGYGPNNPEPLQFHHTEATAPKNDALHAAEEYIAGKSDNPANS